MNILKIIKKSKIFISNNNSEKLSGTSPLQNVNVNNENGRNNPIASSSVSRLGRFIHEVRRMSFGWKPGGAYACGEPRSRRGLLLSSPYEAACSHQRRWMVRRLSQPTSPPPPPPLCEYRIDRIACTLSIIHLPSIEDLAPTRLSFFRSYRYIIPPNSDDRLR